MMFSIIVAFDEKNGIGINNMLPWHLPEDIRRFIDITKNKHADGRRNAVIMGRKTWESIPEKFKPLKGRLNIVLTRQLDYHESENVEVFSELDKALESISDRDDISDIIVIGGSMIYEQAITHSDCQKIYVTKVCQTFECDAFFPNIPEEFVITEESDVMKSENNLQYKFITFEKK